ncbi:MAG: c-type cytochrome [Planctomycetes bacterium]|nr:c-type cytochrome [Planctomycetota bacterium]
MQRPYRVLVPLGVVLAALGSACRDLPRAATAPHGRGAALFAYHCAACHGATGDADTPLANLLWPRPNAFRSGRFKLVSTDNGMPTDADLVATLRRGMPGSTMFAYGWLPDTDLQALAEHVRDLAVAGRAADLLAEARLVRQPLAQDAAEQRARAALRPGAPVATPPATTPDLAALEHGERLYRQHCGACHGSDGRGLPDHREWTQATSDAWARDFTAGFLRGPAHPTALAQRILAGMPAAHMPALRLPPDATAALVAYVTTLIPDGAGDHHTQWPRQIRAARLEALPARDDDPALRALEPVRLPTAPLRWRGDACREVWLRAAHDGHELWLELRWADAQRDDQPRPERPRGDGIAVQWTRSAEPPLLAMGSADAPVNLWRWQSYDPRETAGLVDLLQAPHGGLDAVPQLRPAARAESLRFDGPRAAATEPGDGLPLRATATFRDGEWTAVFRRGLAARDRSEVDLRLPGPLQFAIAIWDGQIDAHAGSKAVTTWHRLEL